MLERLLLDSPWLAMVFGVGVFALEHYMAVFEAYLYQSGLKDHAVYDGLYRLTPE